MNDGGEKIGNVYADGEDTASLEIESEGCADGGFRA